jgi:hypothetical protein
MWIKEILQQIQDIIISILLAVGKEYLSKIQEEIITISTKEWSNTQKMSYIFTYIKKLNLGLKDSAINLLIETLYQRLKVNKAV